MNYMIRAYVANGMVLANEDDLNAMMFGLCAGTNNFYLLNPRNITGYVPTIPVKFSRESGSKIKRARVDILGAPGIYPGPFEVGGGETPALSGATFTIRIGAELKQITVPRFEEWFDIDLFIIIGDIHGWWEKPQTY